MHAGEKLDPSLMRLYDNECWAHLAKRKDNSNCCATITTTKTARSKKKKKTKSNDKLCKITHSDILSRFQHENLKYFVHSFVWCGVHRAPRHPCKLTVFISCLSRQNVSIIIFPFRRCSQLLLCYLFTLTLHVRRVSRLSTLKMCEWRGFFSFYFFFTSLAYPKFSCSSFVALSLALSLCSKW